MASPCEAPGPKNDSQVLGRTVAESERSLGSGIPRALKCLMCGSKVAKVAPESEARWHSGPILRRN